MTKSTMDITVMGITGRGRSGARRLLRAVLALAFVAGGLPALSGCSVNPSTGRRQFILVSSDQTAEMGAAAMPELVQEYGGEVSSPSLRSYVRNIGQQLASLTEAEYADVDWEFTVLDSDVVNAFALPGGKVFISEGLLARLGDEAQLAGVLGHEIGHVTARHVDERISQAAALELGISVLGAATESQLAQLGGQLFGQGYLLRFGRSQELEADAQGLKYMTYAGYDPAALLDVMRVLDEATSGGGQPPEFLSTHPYPETRIEAIQAALQHEYRQTQGNSAYQRHADRFRRKALSEVQVRGDAGSARVAWCSHCAGTSHDGTPALRLVIQD